MVIASSQRESTRRFESAQCICHDWAVCVVVLLDQRYCFLLPNDLDTSNGVSRLCDALPLISPVATSGLLM